MEHGICFILITNSVLSKSITCNYLKRCLGKEQRKKEMKEKNACDHGGMKDDTHAGSPAAALRTCCLDTRCMCGLQSWACTGTVLSPAWSSKSQLSEEHSTNMTNNQRQRQLHLHFKGMRAVMVKVPLQRLCVRFTFTRCHWRHNESTLINTPCITMNVTLRFDNPSRIPLGHQHLHMGDHFGSGAFRLKVRLWMLSHINKEVMQNFESVHQH